MGARPLRTEIREALLDELLKGKLADGDRIAVAALADRFGVSPTPAREALTQLEAEGWLELRPNRGFFVARMTLDEAEAFYPVLSALEGLAVTLHDGYDLADLELLRSINAELRSAMGSPDDAFDLDRQWHRTLVDGCRNPVLLEHLRTLRKRAERYEKAYMRYSARVPTSADHHDRIIASLEEEPDRAPVQLREHWDLSLSFLRNWWRSSRGHHRRGEA